MVNKERTIKGSKHDDSRIEELRIDDGTKRMFWGLKVKKQAMGMKKHNDIFEARVCGKKLMMMFRYLFMPFPSFPLSYRMEVEICKKR